MFRVKKGSLSTSLECNVYRPFYEPRGSKKFMFHSWNAFRSMNYRSKTFFGFFFRISCYPLPFAAAQHDFDFFSQSSVSDTDITSWTNPIYDWIFYLICVRCDNSSTLSFDMAITLRGTKDDLYLCDVLQWWLDWESRKYFENHQFLVWLRLSGRARWTSQWHFRRTFSVAVWSFVHIFLLHCRAAPPTADIVWQ